MNKRERRKPRGEIGPMVLGKRAGFRPLSLPNTKEEIEHFMLTAAREAASRKGIKLFGLIDEPLRTGESDLDFTCLTNEGEQYIELTELAPLELVGGRYDGLPVSYHQGAMADLVCTLLLEKASKYAVRVRPKIHLLAYITDWRFHLSSGVLALVAHWALRRKHELRSIVYFAPMDQKGSELTILHPDRLDRFSSFNEQQVRDRLILRPDLTKLEIENDGSTASIPLSWPPWRGA